MSQKTPTYRLPPVDPSLSTRHLRYLGRFFNNRSSFCNYNVDNGGARSSFQQFPDDIINTICSRCDIHCLDYLQGSPNHQIFFQDFLGFRYTMRILGGGPHVSVKVGHLALASFGGICHCVTFHINLIYQEWSRRQTLGLEQPTCYNVSFQ